MKFKRENFSALALAALCVVSAQAQEDYSTWAHTKAITVNTTAAGGGAGTTGPLRGFPVLLRLTSAQAEIFTQAKAGGADIRFRRLQGPHLPYQIERWDSAGRAAEIWVRLDTVIANNSTQTFNIYWGKGSAADSSKGAATFRIADAFQGVWHFGNSLNDATANAIHGTNTGTVDSAGAVGRGRYFDGASSISLGNPVSMNLTNPFTIEAWVKWAAIGTGSVDRYRPVISHGFGSAEGEFFIHAKNASNAQSPYYSFGHYVNPTNAAETIAGDFASDAGAWVHLTGAYDGTSWLLYRNGVLAASNPRNGDVLNAPTPWYIGAFGNETVSRWFLGSLDEIRFSSVQRDSNWIRLAYHTQKAASTVLTLGPTTVPVSLLGEGSNARNAFSVAASASEVVFRLPPGTGPVRVTVNDMSGREVWSREGEPGATLTMSRKGLVSGVYVARVVVRQGDSERAFQKQFSLAR
jgi:hypothetical protein